MEASSASTEVGVGGRDALAFHLGKQRTCYGVGLHRHPCSMLTRERHSLARGCKSQEFRLPAVLRAVVVMRRLHRS